jgi:hypothetical protein
MEYFDIDYLKSLSSNRDILDKDSRLRDIYRKFVALISNDITSELLKKKAIDGKVSDADIDYLYKRVYLPVSDKEFGLKLEKFYEIGIDEIEKMKEEVERLRFENSVLLTFLNAERINNVELKRKHKLEIVKVSIYTFVSTLFLLLFLVAFLFGFLS